MATYEAGEFVNLDAPKNAKFRRFVHASDEWARNLGFPYRLVSQHGIGAPVRFGKTRAYVVVDEGDDGRPIVETWKIRDLKIWRDNPLTRTTVAADSQRPRASKTAKGRPTTTKAPSRRLMARRRVTDEAPEGFYGNPLSRVKINSPSMATGEPPSKRLKKRRTKTARQAMPGVWANPLELGVKFKEAIKGTLSPQTMRAYGDYYFVQWRDDPAESWSTHRIFEKKTEAESSARALHREHPKQFIRVVKPSPDGAVY